MTAKYPSSWQLLVRKQGSTGVEALQPSNKHNTKICFKIIAVEVIGQRVNNSYM